MVLGHIRECCVCLKATSKVSQYKTNPKLLAGVVLLSPSELACFKLETAIQPENVFAIPYEALKDHHNRCRLEISEVSNSDMRRRLEVAITASSRIISTRKIKLIEILNGEAT